MDQKWGQWESELLGSVPRTGGNKESHGLELGRGRVDVGMPGFHLQHWEECEFLGMESGETPTTGIDCRDPFLPLTPSVAPGDMPQFLIHIIES